MKQKKTGSYVRSTFRFLEGSRRLRSDFDMISSHRDKHGAQRPVHEQLTRYLDSQNRMRKSLRI